MAIIRAGQPGKAVPKKSKGVLEALKVSLVPIGIEIVLPLALITLLSFIFSGGDRFSSVAPHPFWVVLLPIIVHHGTQRGLVCALICSLFLLVGNIPEQLISENLYDYFFKIMHKPLLWFITAFILGELRMRHIQEIKDLKQKAIDAGEHKNVLEKAFQNLKKIKEALEVRIAAEFRTPATPLRSVGRMIETTPDKVIDNFIKSVEELINPDKFSIFVLEENCMNLMYQHGWDDKDNYRKTFDSSTQLYHGIVDHKRDLCIIDRIGEKILEDQGVFALPMVDPNTNISFAMVKFEKITFRELNISNIEAIRELCRCACKAYVLSLEVLKTEMRPVELYGG